jgi:hypothetical protein
MRDKKLGYLTSSPSNIGTAMKISVRIKIPHISQDSRIIAMLKKLNLNINYRLFNENNKQIRQDETDKNTIVEISSFYTLGKSEVIINLVKFSFRIKRFQQFFLQFKVEIAQLFADSINKLIDIEKRMENGGSLTDVL